MQDILVNIGGIVLMGAIVWWFWLSDSGTPSSENPHQH